MPQIPPEIIRASIKAGSVYYFPEESFSSSEPHYFVVLNRQPHTDEVIVLACGSSQIEKTLRRRPNRPPETFVIISPKEYEDFQVETIFDCNRTNDRILDVIMRKYSEGSLKVKTEMNMALVERLRKGVIASREIESRIKALL